MKLIVKTAAGIFERLANGRVKFNPNHDPADGRFSSGGSGGSESSQSTGGSHVERYRDRIEGTQAEADNEVKKADRKIKKAKAALDAAIKARDDHAAVAKGVLDHLKKQIDENATRMASIKERQAASKSKLAELQAKLAAMKKKKSEEDDIGDDIDAELVTLKSLTDSLRGISSNMDELLEKIQNL